MYATTLFRQLSKPFGSNQSTVEELKEVNLVDHYTYKFQFLYKSIRGLIKKQNISTDVRKIYKVGFTINEQEYLKWQNTFQTLEEDVNFSFYLKSSTALFLRFTKDLGVNYKNILHLRNELEYKKQGHIFTPGKYKNAAWVSNIFTAGKKNLILKFSSKVKNDNGVLIATNVDYFMVKNVDAETIAAVKAQEANKLNYRKWLIPQKFEQEQTQVTEVMVPKNMGLQYGAVSGDMNMVHTTTFFAKIFGFKRAFVQGLCTANYVVSNSPFKTNFEAFSINFSKPVYTNSKVKITYGSSGYCVRNGQNHVVAHGEYSL